MLQLAVLYYVDHMTISNHTITGDMHGASINFISKMYMIMWLIIIILSNYGCIMVLLVIGFFECCK